MYRQKLFTLILLSAIIRIITASVLELGNDEVYYYTYALHLQSNYFDHPPGVAFLIRLFTFNLALTHEVFIRLGSIVFAALGTVLSYNIGKLIATKRAGWFAAILYNTSLYSSIIAGTFILPDSPQVVFWLAALYMGLEIVNKASENKKIAMRSWIAFGILNGLCIMCKVHGVFLWGALGLYAILYQGKLFLKPGFYLALFLTACILSPMIWWNFQNDFVTWNFHSNRVEATRIDKDSFIQALFGQLFYNNPINVVITVISVISLKKMRLAKQHYTRLLLLCGLPMLIVVSVMSLFNSVLPHWSGPAFLSLSFLTAAYLDKRFSSYNAFAIPSVLKWSAGLILFLFVAGTGFIHLYPGTIGSKETNKLGENDFTLNMYGWKRFGAEFSQWYKAAEKQQVFAAGTTIVSNKWFPAAHLDYYVARPMKLQVVGLGNLQDLHHYAWLNQYRPGLQLNQDALTIIPTDSPGDPEALYSAYFHSIELIYSYPEYRNNKLCRYYKVYLLKGFKGDELQANRD